MADRKTENSALIEKLSRDLKPVRVKSRKRLAIEYFVTLMAFCGLFLGLLGAAHGHLVQVGQISFLSSLVVFGLIIAVGSVILAQYSRPGVGLSRPVAATFWSLLGLAAIIQVIRFCAGQNQETWGPPLAQGWECAVAAVLMGGMAAGVLLFEIRREAPVKLASAARLMLVTAGAMGGFVLQIHCPNEHPIHELLWHNLVPLAVFASSARLFAHLTLRW